MRKLLIPLLFVLSASLIWLSCGGAASSGTHTSGLPYRAFISNRVSSGSSSAGIFIVDAQKDVFPRISPIAGGNTPGMMVETPNHARTLVFSGNNLQSSDNQFSIIDNTSESSAGHVTLPGYTESIAVSPDSSTAYVAVPNARVVGQSQGAIEVINLNGGAVSEVDIPSVHYLWIDNGGDRLLAFSDVLASLAPPCTNPAPSFAFVVTPSDVGVQSCPVVPIPGFDHPVQAYFSSDDRTAYVVNCGSECGGNKASIQTLDMTTGTPGTAVDVCVLDENSVEQCAASIALLSGSTMYVAGTPYSGGVPSLDCKGQQTAATTCGMVAIFDLNNMSVINTAPIRITDGYHNRIALGANGQLFIGARTCTEIVPPQPPPQGAEVRGCLSIYNTLTTMVGSVAPGGVVIPAANGDVTGIQPIGKRLVVYVVQGGFLSIYDATIDALEFNPNNPNDPGQIFGLVGDFIDVKTVDF